MLTKDQAKSLLRDLNGLPLEKLMEVQDFVQFLKGQCSASASAESDKWTDEDLNELAKAVEDYAELAVPWNGPV